MEKLKDPGLLARLLLLLFLVPFLGFTPRPHATQNLLQGAQRAVDSGSFETAASRTAAAARQLPGRSDLWERAGRYALQAGQTHQAIQYLENAGPASLSLESRLILGDAYQKSGNLPGAVNTWRAALEDNGPLPQLYDRLWQAEFALKDYPTAISDLRTLLADRPADAFLYYQLGLILATQKPEEALDPLAQAARLNKGLKGSADLLRRSILTGRLAGDPGYILLAAGRALASLGKWDLATEAFHQATLTRPDYAEA